MRILLSAFSCSPGEGSEAGVGWGTAINLARNHTVHVLTARRHRPAIEAFLLAEPVDRLSFSYFDFPEPLVRLVCHTVLWQFYYYAWQLRIAGWARPVAEQFNPDLIHHVTYGRYWTPSSLWQLGPPFVWGPVGGGDRCPRELLCCLSFWGRISERCRDAAQALAHRDPALRATARHAAIALAGTAETEKRMVSLGCPRTLLFLQTAIDAGLIAADCSSARAGAVFCSVGRLLGWKGQELAIRAFAQARIPGAKLMILGEGPTRRRLERMAARLGIAHAVEFLGAVPRSEVLQCLRQSIALIHPSLHDQAPTVVFEAMAVGTPVIGLAVGGITLQVPPDSGILIAAQSPDQTIADLAAAMRRIASNPALGCRMGEAGRRNLQAHFTWRRKAEMFDSVYRTVMAERASRAQPATAVDAWA